MLGHDPDICAACGLMNELESTPLAVDNSKLFVLTRRRQPPMIRAGPSKVGAPKIIKVGV